MLQYKIPLIKPLLPSYKEYIECISPCFKTLELSNFGPLHTRLESIIQKRFETPSLLLANGTLALTCALRSFSLRGEVITTPFTFAATIQAIEMAGLTPVFADIDPNTLCLSPSLANAAITKETCAVVPVHVFGTPCDVIGFERLSSLTNTKIIYDSAHAFDLTIDGTPISKFGDASAYSFHATKLFQTVEGGALAFARSGTAFNKASLWRCFGLENEKIISEGTNAKLSELHSAMGLCVLPLIEQERKNRYKVAIAYHNVLGGVEGLQIHTSANAQYFALQISRDFAKRENVMARLDLLGVATRAYFSPSLNEQPYYAKRFSGSFPNALKASQECLCLPFYGDLGENNATQIAELILKEKR